MPGKLSVNVVDWAGWSRKRGPSKGWGCHGNAKLGGEGRWPEGPEMEEGEVQCFPKVRPWALGVGVSPYLRQRKCWGRGKAAGAGASEGPGGRTVGAPGPAGPWSVQWAQVWPLVFERCHGRNVGAPCVLSRPQELWLLLPGRERVKPRVRRRVPVQGSMSKWKPVRSGVPQGHGTAHGGLPPKAHEDTEAGRGPARGDGVPPQPPASGSEGQELG